MDFGSKWIGLAVGDTEFRVATPRPRLAATGTLAKDAQAIVELAKREQATGIAVGSPVDEDGGPTPMSKVCGQLADRIQECGLPVRLVDERLTSVESLAQMSKAGLKGAEQKRKKDGESAARILERLFDRGWDET